MPLRAALKGLMLRRRTPVTGFIRSGSVQPYRQKDRTMNQIIYIVGAIVIVLALLSFVGLR
jgi:hypothetical protein